MPFINRGSEPISLQKLTVDGYETTKKCLQDVFGKPWVISLLQNDDICMYLIYHKCLQSDSAKI